MGRIRHYAGTAYRKVRPKPEKEAGWGIKTAGLYPDLSIGEHTYGKISVISDYPEHTLRIGDYCSLAEDATFWIGGGHRTGW